MHDGIIWCPHCKAPHALGTKVCPTTAKSLDRTITKTAEHPLVGTMIGGKYLVTKHLGTGGAGSVFEAENRILRRMVAIKLVDATATPQAVKRLESEALLVSAVQHPNICDVYDVGVLRDGSPYIVLERLYGETLASLLRRKKQLDAETAFDVFAQLLSGLQAAHGAHIVHRDLKPENVFLVDRLGCAPLVKILDFGFAKDISGLRVRSNTHPGSLLGTIKYMSPEMLDRKPIDERTDIFGAGLMMFEALVGHSPYEDPLRKAEVPPEHIAEVFRAARPDLPPAVADVVARAIARSPDDRFASAIELQRALGAAFRIDAHRDDPPSSRAPDSI